DAAMATRGFDAVQRLAPTSVATGIPITDLAAAFRTAKDLPEVPAAELLVWKRVEDGLPEPGEVVLVAYDDWSGRNIEQARAVKHGFCKPTNDYDVGVDDVTHWAPMPKGPTP
ncbi:MAG TPA: DUF551 domain-containing protein, partial [Polyangiaceae bacterium]|nr:DUF551 domain-containing protein [Polyangiaceae bacterium]